MHIDLFFQSLKLEFNRHSVHSISTVGGESNLTTLEEVSSSDRELALLLITAMICSNPTGRPPASAICNYPIFWNLAEILGFFQVYNKI